MTVTAGAVGVAPATLHPRIATGVTVAGLDPAALVRDHGSPLYVYDLDVMCERVAMLRAALPADRRGRVCGQVQPLARHPASTSRVWASALTSPPRASSPPSPARDSTCAR